MRNNDLKPNSNSGSIRKSIVILYALSFVLFLSACEINYEGFLSNSERNVSESSNSDSQEFTHEMAEAEDQKWRDDLEQLKHDITWYNTAPFERYGEEAFNNLYDDIYQDIPYLSDNEIEYKFRELIYSIGDGHIDIWTENESDYSLPIMIDELDDGYYVVNVTKGYEGLMGEKVETINGHKIEDLIDKLEKISNSENKYWQRAGAIDKLHQAYFYNLLEIQEGRNKKIKINDKEVKFINMFFSLGSLEWVKPLELGSMPNSIVKEDAIYNTPYSYSFSEDGKILRINFSSCYYEYDDYSLVEFGKDIYSEAEIYKPEVLLIDLRDNGGGRASQLYAAISEKFFKEFGFINSPKFYVAINEGTFSAGVLTAHVLKDKFGATLIGTPTGGSPYTTGVTDTANKVLKNTGINFRVSSAKVGKKMIEHPSELPDVMIKRTFDDLKNDRDPILDYINSF